MKRKSPTIKPHIGGQKKIAKKGEPKPQTAIKPAPANRKKESRPKMKKESSMKMMKNSPAKKAMNTNSTDTIKKILEPGIVKLNRVLKGGNKNETFVHSTQNAPKGSKIKGDGELIKKPKANSSQTKTKKKVSFAEAYKKRDMKTYGNLSQSEYTKEAKRQIANKKATTKAPRAKTVSELNKDIKSNKGTGKGGGGYMTKGSKGSYDAPKSQMKGSVLGPKTKGGDATNQKAVKTTTTTKTTPKVTVKKPKTVKEAKAARKTARKSVRAARKEFGRGSAEVKAAKTTKKAAKQEVKTAKKTRKTVKKVARVTKRAIKRGTKAADKFIKKFNKENA